MHLPDELSNEHYQKLYRFQDEVLGVIERTGSVFYLGGGTALSRFHYNHRFSDDLDFFTLEEMDFIEVVQGIHQKLEGNGFRVSTYGFSQGFCRVSLMEPVKHPDLTLKCDFIATMKGSHIGVFVESPAFSLIDNTRNILAEKLSFVYKKSPKDIADIWVICRNLSFNWGDILEEANRKRATVPLLVAEALETFPAENLGDVRWFSPIQVDHFERDREIMIQNIVTKENNWLFEKNK